MGSGLVNVCYEGDSGSNEIRTCYVDGILFISLNDIFVTLNKENKQLDHEQPAKFIPSMIKSQLKDLDDDEFTHIPTETPRFEGELEIFVTQPGLNRVMGSDKSKAGKKFQRWLYHEVIPSLQKHGVYPPPVSAQGSALAQMAEIVAQNSRMLADTIFEHEKLKQEVTGVKADVLDVGKRVEKLENSDLDSKYILTVRDWFNNANLPLSANKEFEIVTWCENLSLRQGRSTIKCPSNERMNVRFHQGIIKEAKDLVENATG
ncbi:BRO-like protein [Pseudoalteromonas sp. MMG024]|uniref:BRO-N domain-containing protein n=1 Tax=Pseudoalteromonas sp. MMG024 TaxID=2909980 RepID=UPI001F1CE94B|nr:BRO-like protein [Pseudoalteromonas sp. MMG024]MCF6456485.1 BRO-like protein [Pseudoalteromonas sp. MMG024]